MSTSIQKEQSKDPSAIAITKAGGAKRRAHTTLVKAKTAGKAAHLKKPAARRGTKTARILELLKRPGGVTLKQLMKATGWQAHSVRGFLRGTLGQKMERPVRSSKSADAERTYCLFSK